MPQMPMDEPVQIFPPLRRAIVAFTFILVAEFFYAWSWNTIDVLRPYIRESLGLTLTQVGAGYSAQGIGALIGAIVLGQLADRFGRRAMLATVMVGYGLGVIAGAFVGDLTQLLVQRFVLGLFLGGIFPVVVGTYCSLFDGSIRGRLASLVNAVASAGIAVLGLAIGALPALAGIVNSAGGNFARDDWHLLLWIGGVPPILLAGLALVLIPKSVDTRAYSAAPVARLPITELFAPGLRTRTMMLALLTGLNFFAYQAYSGWLTTYLRDERSLEPATIGQLVAWQFAANIVGCFFWGWAGDRYGRRFPALGFIIAAVAIAIYLNVPTNLYLLGAVGMVYGFMLSASVIWGPWLTELYPAHLKSTAASIFNWGRLFSFFAPLVTGELARNFGLGVTMGVGSVTFFIAGALWLALPETHARPLFTMFARRRAVA